MDGYLDTPTFLEDTIYPDNVKKEKKMLQNTDNCFTLKNKIKVYASNGIGTKIIDAVTGNNYNRLHTIGSIHEDKYFKVRISSGEMNNHLGSLFYSTPEDYERHQHVTVDNATKQKWLSKNKSD